MSVTPDKPKEPVNPIAATKDCSKSPSSSSSGMNTLSSDNSIGDPLANYEFAEVKKSKFFANNESESDYSDDSRENEIEKWQKNLKKRKQKNVGAEIMLKKQDRKTTPKAKNK